MYIFCSADRTKPGTISLLTSAWKPAPDHFIMLKLNKLEKQTIRPAAEVYDACAQLCSVAVQFEDEKNSVMLIGTYGNRRSCVRMGGPLQTDQMRLEVKHNGTVQIKGRQNRAVHH